MFMSDPRTPTNTTDRWVGVEIECLILDLEEFDLAAFREPLLLKYMQIGSDRSVSAGIQGQYHDPAELRVCAPAQELPKVLEALGRLLRKHRAYANISCGLHIHLDMRGLNHKHAYRNLLQSQKLLFSITHWQRQTSRYCRAVPPQTVWPRRQTQVKYWAINHNSWWEYRTLEVRLFAGTVDPARILKYVEVCSDLAYREKPVPPKRALIAISKKSLKTWIKKERVRHAHQ